MTGLLQDLHTKVSADATEVKAFKAYSAWCAEKAEDDGHQEETLLADIASTKAAIEKYAAEVESTGADINSLRPGLHHQTQSWQQRQLFARKRRLIIASQKPSWPTRWGTLERDISIIQREMSKNPVFLQKKLTHEQSAMSFQHSPR